MGQFLDMREKRFGRLVVKELSHMNKQGDAMWTCLCDCGNECVVRGQNLRMGKTKSCSCLNKEILRKRIKHGQARRVGDSAEYVIWSGIKNRCLSENNNHYDDYGGRGITVSASWLGEHGFENFFKDMGKRPSPHHQIDRIKNDLGYSKNNCRWALPKVQALNKRLRKTNKFGVNGIFKLEGASSYQVKIGVNKKQIHIGCFSTLEEAIAARKLAEEKYHKPILDAA